MNKRVLFFAILPIFIFTIIVIYNIKKSNISITDLKAKKQLQIEAKNSTQEIAKRPQPNEDDFKLNTSLDIIGDENFKSKIKDSLRILWLYDKEKSFSLIRRYIFEIRQSNRTCFNLTKDSSYIEISDQIYKKSSLTYLASVIAHQSWHIYYLIEKNKKNTIVLPPGEEKIDKKFIPPMGLEFKKFNDLFTIEDKAFEYQISILEKINAPKKEIRLLINRDKKDFSPSHDGNCLIKF